MPNYLTPKGAKRLAEELEELLTVERPRVVQEVAEAAAQGDRSENAEYIYGKRRLAEIDRRIRFLSKRLETAEVVHTEELEHTKVRFGAIVEVEDEQGKRARYVMVGPDEANPGEGKVSFHAPLGRALLNRSVGDRVIVRRPAGELKLEILSITYE